MTPAPTRSAVVLRMRARSTQRARLRMVWVLAAWCVAVLASSPRAFAIDNRAEATAKGAMKKAVTDFRAKAFGDAIARLQTALDGCGTDHVKCTPKTSAALLRDIATMRVLNGEKELASPLFVEALVTDPKVELNSTYDSPDVRAEWAASKDEAAFALTGQPTGDFPHEPAAEQAVDTPIPVFVETSASRIGKIRIHYKGPGMTEMKSLDLGRRQRGWGALIPCSDVKRGVVRYYVEELDSSGEVIGTAGSTAQMFAVPVRWVITSAPPSLPGATPPKSCEECRKDPSSCAGETADSDAPKGDVGDACVENDQCASNHCIGGECVLEGGKPGAKGRAPKVWIGVTGSIDFVVMSAANDICRLTPQAAPSAGYYCTNPDGTDFPTRASAAENSAIAPGKGGDMAGGFRHGDIRVLASFDYAALPNLLLGARAGYAFGTYPGQSAHTDGRASSAIHLELRGTYLFGDNPLASTGLVPYAFASAGASEFDAQRPVSVYLTNVAGARSEQAWLITGPWFVAAGGGGRYALSERAAVLLGGRATFAFGAGGLVPILAPELSIQYGF